MFYRGKNKLARWKPHENFLNDGSNNTVSSAEMGEKGQNVIDQFFSVQHPISLVHQVKLRIQALINILIFTERLILSLTPLHSQYCVSTKTA